MNVEFANISDTVEAPAIRLKEVYCIKADKSYHAYKGADRHLSGYVVIRTIAGHGRIHIEGGSEIGMEAPSILMVEYSRIIEYRPADNEWDFWWFAFDLAGLSIMPLNECQPLPCTEKEQKLMRECLTHLQYASFLSHLTASSYMGLLLGYWSQHMQKTCPPCYNKHIDDLLQYIQHNLDKPLSVNELAGRCYITPRQLYNAFLKATNTSPKKYILKLRMEKGAYLLLNTNQSVSAIANTLGYPDPLYFSRLFRTYIGVSPNHYRKERQGTRPNDRSES